MKNAKVGQIVTISKRARHCAMPSFEVGSHVTITSITSNGRAHVKNMFGGCADFWLDLLDEFHQEDTPLQKVEKKYKRQVSCTIIDTISTHEVKPTVRDMIDIINNPHTIRVRVKFKNGRIFREATIETGFNGVLDCLNHNRSYHWVVVGA